MLAEAESEAEEAARWYEGQRDGLGNEFLDELARGLETIETSPHAFTRLGSPRSAREVRRFVLQRFPFKIIYEVRANEVLVLAVAHARRRPYYWRRRKG
jgi:toxin ParE1/3/4